MGMKKYYKFEICDFGLNNFCFRFRTLILLLVIIPFILAGINTYSQTMKIGVALPLFRDTTDESMKALGNDILNGIKFAFSEFKPPPNTDIILEFKDTKRDINNTVNIFKQFAANDTVQCVLGPVFSSELAEVADIASSEKIPIISPTATGDELASGHDYVFQLNPSYEVRGKLMADYLMKVLGMHRFVIMAEESYGKNFMYSFINEVDKQGGKTLLTKTYSRDTKDIDEITSEISSLITDNDLFINLNNLNVNQRLKLESAGVRSGLIDSLLSLKKDVSIYYLLGDNALKIIDTMSLKPYPLKGSTDNVIEGYIDAIYIPISNSSEIGMILPELYSINHDLFIAGTGDWNSEGSIKMLDANKKYIKHLIFESEYFLDNQSTQVLDLKSRLDTKYTLNKNFLFGYDAMKLLLSVIAQGNKTRRQINDALEKVKSFDAIKSKISLDYNRVNSELNILSYDGKLIRIGIYKISK